MSSYKRFNRPHKLVLGVNREMYTKGEGKLKCYFGLGDDNDWVSNYAVIMHNVLFVPKLSQSLFSIKKVDE